MKGFALGLGLKKRLRATRKWATDIEFGCFKTFTISFW